MTEFEELVPGKSEKMTDGEKVAVICAGPVANRAYETAVRLREETGICPAVYNIRYLKPMDEEMLAGIADGFSSVITIEDGCIKGGLFGEVSEYVASHGLGIRVHALGIPDRFIGQGSQKELRAECGYDTEGIYAAMKEEMGKF